MSGTAKKKKQMGAGSNLGLWFVAYLQLQTLIAHLPLSLPPLVCLPSSLRSAPFGSAINKKKPFLFVMNLVSKKKDLIFFHLRLLSPYVVGLPNFENQFQLNYFHPNPYYY